MIARGEFGRALVTGGAGFIGSHVVDRLIIDGHRVVVLDNFSTGRIENLSRHAGEGSCRVVDGDVLDRSVLDRAMEGCDSVFHFQANADVRGGPLRTELDLQQNTIATWNVLESARQHGVQRFIFASSAAVYGEPRLFPTPESYAPDQTSLYGASKLACEAMIQAYSEYFGIQSFSFRFVSWVGERYSHGVVRDFVDKLRRLPGELEVLGDGSQSKSFLHVADGIDGIFLSLSRLAARKNVINLGHDELVSVRDVAQMVIDELGLKDVQVKLTGGKRGWIGDSPVVHLDTSVAKNLGWRPRVSIQDGIRRTVRSLVGRPAAS